MGKAGVNRIVEPHATAAFSSDRNELMDFEAAIEAARASRVPVLITGSPTRARRIAIAIVGQPAANKIMICDATDQRDVAASIEALEYLQNPGMATLLVREVQSLNGAGRAALLRMVNNPASSPRVIASASMPLFNRVVEGRFEADLFFRLSMIQIVATD